MRKPHINHILVATTKKVLVFNGTWLELPASLSAEEIEERVNNYKLRILNQHQTYNPKQNKQL